LQRRVIQQEHHQQRQALLNELAARFRHRIGNDLGGIQLSAKRLTQDLPKEKRQQSVDVILQAAEAMAQEVYSVKSDFLLSPIFDRGFFRLLTHPLRYLHSIHVSRFTLHT